MRGHILLHLVASYRTKLLVAPSKRSWSEAFWIARMPGRPWSALRLVVLGKDRYLAGVCAVCPARLCHLIRAVAPY